MERIVSWSGGGGGGGGGGRGQYATCRVEYSELVFNHHNRTLVTSGIMTHYHNVCMICRDEKNFDAS